MVLLKKSKRYIYYSVLCSLFLLVTGFKVWGTDSPLPKGYGSVTLGMTLDEVKEALKTDPAYNYRGDRDVSLLSGENRALISVDGVLFFEECLFQFEDDVLYIITLNLNKSELDYYSVFSKLCEKYGEPDSLSPEKSQWNNGSVIFSLEKNLSLRYIDASTFEELQKSSLVEKTAREKTRQDFLDSL